MLFVALSHNNLPGTFTFTLLSTPMHLNSNIDQWTLHMLVQSCIRNPFFSTKHIRINLCKYSRVFIVLFIAFINLVIYVLSWFTACNNTNVEISIAFYWWYFSFIVYNLGNFLLVLLISNIYFRFRKIIKWFSNFHHKVTTILISVHNHHFGASSSSEKKYK